MADAMKLVLELAKAGADKAGCDGWRAQQKCRQIVELLERASPPAREEAPAEGAGAFYDLEEHLKKLEASEVYAYEKRIADLEHQLALRNRTSEPEAGAVACKATLGTRGDCSTIAGCDCPAPATADKLRVAVEALEFFKWARNFFWCDEGSEIDGCDFQDAAERIGLIVKVPFDPDRHTDNGYGLEAGDDWFETAPHIDQALTALNEQPQ